MSPILGTDWEHWEQPGQGGCKNEKDKRYSTRHCRPLGGCLYSSTRASTLRCLRAMVPVPPSGRGSFGRLHLHCDLPETLRGVFISIERQPQHCCCCLIVSWITFRFLRVSRIFDLRPFLGPLCNFTPAQRFWSYLLEKFAQRRVFGAFSGRFAPLAYEGRLQAKMMQV